MKSSALYWPVTRRLGPVFLGNLSVACTDYLGLRREETEDPLPPVRLRRPFFSLVCRWLGQRPL